MSSASKNRNRVAKSREYPLADPQTLSRRDLTDKNRRFYDLLWSGSRLVEPERFNTWPLVQSLLPACTRRLEIGPGLRPRLPIDGTQFVDISTSALQRLRGRGAQAILGQVTRLPFAGGTFDLVCALDIIEHVDNDEDALSEVSRVARSGGTVIVSMPLHPARWTRFDELVGHKRRYEPAELLAKLARHHLWIERSAVFGMQPRSSRLVDLGMWWLLNHREWAMWWYNRAFTLIGLRFQNELRLAGGMIAADSVDEVLLVCRKDATARTHGGR